MTSQEIAEKIVALFAALGFPARTEAMDDSFLDSVKVFVGAAPERYAFLVFPSGVASARIETLQGHLRPQDFARADSKLPKRWAEVKRHCKLIVEVVRRDDQRRAEIGMARTVVDELRALGLPALVVAGRVSVTLDLSPEYAAEVGPKIAAVMSEKKESAT